MRILFVSGFSSSTRARELALEFERFGPLIRCDVPAPRHSHSRTVPYAFVEFREGRDAENAYHEMHDRNFEGHRLSVQWARKPPSAAWRVSDGSAPPSRSDRDSRARSRSPRRRSPERRRDRDTEPRDRRRHSSRGRNRDEARTPPPPLYATPMAAVDDYQSDRRDTGNDREYRDARDSDQDYKGSSRDHKDSNRDRRNSSRDRGDRSRDYDDREVYRREDAGAPLNS
ncbi:MAG: hypothetical protein NXY57DRAFT_1003432 [Lentinula lateritia]|uniref:RRM domain-containing protein n=1 Tax=Lentinula lateritia TaxID=40482 RepID=A0ABQ8VY45_9AGAR|nr:MAG: hypothetical protein NXY57DRAFT_1003432 [Lentinula lateritia]KAJ4500472.1 hypothetical protein C8R41DRAFT_907555 [Lentinula lateritia]